MISFGCRGVILLHAVLGHCIVLFCTVLAHPILPERSGADDDDTEHTNALLVDINRPGICNGGPLASRMPGKDKPARTVRLHGVTKPLLIDEGICDGLELAALELGVAFEELVSVNLQKGLAADNILQFDRGVAELMHGGERSIQPAERDRRNGRLGQELRQEDEFALVRFVGLEKLSPGTTSAPRYAPIALPS